MEFVDRLVFYKYVCELHITLQIGVEGRSHRLRLGTQTSTIWPVCKVYFVTGFTYHEKILSLAVH